MPSDRDAAATGDAGWRRLHPLTLLFALGSRLYGLRGLVLPAGFAVVVSHRRTADGGWSDLDDWLVGPAALLLLFELGQYFTLAYRFDRHEIVIKRGLIWKRVRHIPYARIQNIELVQHAAHRLAGVAVVRLDTGTGAGAEGELSVLSLDAVAALREAVRRGRRDDPSAAAAPGEAEVVTPPGVLVSLDVRELLLHGLLTSRGWVVIAAALGALWQVDLDAWGVRRFLPSGEGVLGSLRQATSTLAVEIALIAVGAALLFRVLSAVWSAIKHFDFSLTARGDELFQSYGLLTRVGRTIPRPRIQKLTISEAPLMRLFRRASLTVDTAASVAERQSQQASGGSHVLVPIVPSTRVSGLIHEVYPTGGDTGAGVDGLAWQGVDPRALTRLLRVRLVVAVIMTGASAPTAHWWALAIGLTAASVITLQAWLAVRFTSFAWCGDTIWFRSGAWTRQVSLVRAARVQVVSLEQSALDRRWGMAGLRVDTAGAASGGHHVHIRWLPADVADALYARLRHAAAP